MTSCGLIRYENHLVECLLMEVQHPPRKCRIKRFDDGEGGVVLRAMILLTMKSVSAESIDMSINLLNESVIVFSACGVARDLNKAMSLVSMSARLQARYPQNRNNI